MTELKFNDIIEWNALNETERTDILRRPAVLAGDKITAVVSGIIKEVETRGDDALREFSARFDRTEVKNFRVTPEEVDAAVARLPEDFMKALRTAADNIKSSTQLKSLTP